MARIKLENVTKTFGDVVAVNNMSLEVNHGEFFTLLGPPGAGKTTTLRLIVGLEQPDEGAVFLDNTNVTNVYPGKRDIAMIFQNLALYPNKTVFDNIAYPLRERKVDKATIAKTVHETAEKLQITPLLKRKPGQLSGGERQRVAIGRAIIRRPHAYLMDEPLSALDALLRTEMRIELKRLQADLQQTLIYVTHDQIEALSMSDRIGVLSSGVLQQIDRPEVVYVRPRNRFVAINVGSPPTNFIPCMREGTQLKHPTFERTLIQDFDLSDNAHTELGIRPENVHISFEQNSKTAILGEIFEIEPLGAEVVVDLKLGDDLVKATVSSPFEGKPGDQVWIQIDSTAAHILDTTTDEFVAYGSMETPMFADE